MERLFGYFISVLIGIIYFFIIHFLLYRVRLKYVYGLFLPFALSGVLAFLVLFIKGGWEQLGYIIMLIIIGLALLGYFLSWIIVFMISQSKKR